MRIAASLALPLLTCSVLAAPQPANVKPADTFLVDESGFVLLRPDGTQKERLVPSASNGALSPDGRWLACLQAEKAKGRSQLVIRPLDGKGATVAVPEVSVAVGEGCLPVWSADGRRLLVGESRGRVGGGPDNTFRIYDLATRKLTELKLPEGAWVTGWSKDGKRLLATVRPDADSLRVCWLNADGTGEPEFLTPKDEVAAGPRLSPDGRRILFKAARKTRVGDRHQWRLYALDLATKKRVMLDEPGETNGYCWSPDGQRVAFTWQQTPPKAAGVAVECETFLITCNADGTNIKKLTSRKYTPVTPGSVVIFFQVIDWR